MRTMASVWFFVLVLIAVQEVYGNLCDNMDLDSCDECIRCGGSWCNSPGYDRCVLERADNWCPDHQEDLIRVDYVTNPGDLVTPVYVERTLAIEIPDAIDIHYTLKKDQKTKITVVNSTQSKKIDVWEQNRKCKGLNCTTTIHAKPTIEFCSASGSNKEFVYVTVEVGGLEEVVALKYHVPCACECSQIVERNSKHCSGHGDYSCGLCTCHSYWTGDDCNKLQCHGRGDITCRSPINDLDCSGNGYCGPCESCVCFTDREGYQYFDQQNYCADLCMVMSSCDDCLANNTLGVCDSCVFNDKYTYMMKYNESLLAERDYLNRTVWMKCNETIDDCQYNYVVKKDEEDNMIVMVVESCNDVLIAGQTAAPQVPIILGVIGLLAAVAAVGGVMIWKHMTALPPPPLNNPGYQNIDAEDCTGENPLYKPPTTNFQNPTYGKW